MSILYYYDTSWHTSTPGLGAAWSETVKSRFAVLGGSQFITNSVNGMKDSSDMNTWGTTNSIGTYKPSLVYRYGARLVAAGDATYPDRVFFSSIIDPSTSPFITWNVNATTGDWIDVNPDDGGYITAFSETSTFLLLFKNNGMYRVDTVNKSTDPQNIFNIGAVSQEAVTLCQGITYFFSGIDIRQTDGGFPQQISRAGVQDIINAIPQSSWSSVSAGNDGLNVYFDIGDVTINTNEDDQTTITNCRLKFSPRDQSWSIHSYSKNFKFSSLFTDTNGSLMRSVDDAGDVQTINLGTTDDGTAIDFQLETQDLEFDNRSHLKNISDKIVVFTKAGGDSFLQCKMNGEAKNIPLKLNRRVNIGEDIKLSGFYFNLLWSGESNGTPAVFEGFSFPDIDDKGITYE